MQTSKKEPMILQLGQLTMTSGVDAIKRKNKIFSRFCIRVLNLHRKCDWGDTNPQDKESNDYAVKEGLRVISVYKVPRTVKIDQDRIWIITEANRRSTCILFPSEY